MMQKLLMLSMLVVLAGAACGGCRGDANNAADAGMDMGEDVAPDVVEDMALPPTCVETGCSGAQMCDDVSGSCVDCLDSMHCAEASAPICRSGACVACTTDTQCAAAVGDGAPVGETCRNDGQCVACERDVDCPDTEPYCTSAGTCVRCQDNRDCPNLTPACLDGACMSCGGVDACTDEERLRELAAGSCADAILLEGVAVSPTTNTLIDGLQAAICADAANDFLPAFSAPVKAVAAGRATIDREAFDACVSGDADACDNIYVPQQVAGDECYIGNECVSGVCDTAMCPGSCASRSAVGGSCASGGDCALALTCVNTTCIEPPALGEDCANICGEGFCSAGTCVAKLLGGEACTRDFECVEDHYCHVSGICVPLPVVGEFCAPGDRLPCVSGVRCFKGVCQEPLAAGSLCEATQQCAAGYRCIEDACTAVLLPGDVCTQSAACALGLGCIDGRCRPLPDVGEPCFEEGGCIRGVCDLGTNVCTPVPDGASCSPVETYNDLFDVCGDTSSCTPTGTGSATCEPEGGVGALCGTFDAGCSAPDLRCNSNDICEPVCAAQAP